MISPVHFDDASGVTLIELLLVVAIIAIVGAMTTPFLSRFVLRSNHNTSIERVISGMRKAQAYAMDGKNGATWGVCRIGNTVRMFSGSCNAPTTAEDYVLPGTVTVSTINSTIFNVRGEPSAALSFTISSSIRTSTISMNIAGGVTVN